MLGLCAVLVVGGHVLVWADDPARGLVGGNPLFDVWALGVYAGFLPAAYLLLLSRTSRGLPAGYRAALVGAVVFLVALVAEFAWRSVGLRTTPGPEGVLAPSRLALFVGAALLLSGPLLSFAGRVRNGPKPESSVRTLASVDSAAFAVSVGLLLALSALLTGFIHPFVVVAGAPVEAVAQQTPTDLYLVPLDGSGSHRLTVTPTEWEAHPDVSVDGSRVAFARGALEDFRVFVAGVDGSAASRLTDRQSHEDGAIWSHDGSQVALWAALPDAAPAPAASGPAPGPGSTVEPAPLDLSGLAIWLYDAGGDNGRTLLSEGGVGAEAWSPDDTKLCGWTVAAGTFDIAVWDLATFDTVAVTATNKSQEWGCTWSPDGTRIAFHSDRDGDWELYSALPDGSDVRQLTDDPGIDQWPHLSPDGTQLAFMSSRGGELDLWLANPDGSAPRNLTNDPALEDGYYGFSWLPDGSGLICASAGRGYASPAPSETVPLGVGAIALNALIFVAVLLFALRLAGPIVGVGTVAGLIGGLLAALIGAEALFFIAPLAGGVAADIVAWWAGGGSRRRLAVVMAGLGALTMVAVYFVALAATRGFGWGLDLVIGSIGLSAVLGAGLALVVGWPDEATIADT